MILDARNLLSDKQAITASAPSTDVLDIGAEGQTFDGVTILKRKGVGEMIPLYIGVNEDFDNLTSLDIAIETDDNSGFASAKVVLTVNVPLADLVAGYIFPIDKLPRKVTERYLRFNYTVNGAAPANGTISAGFVAAVDGMNKSGF